MKSTAIVHFVAVALAVALMVLPFGVIYISMEPMESSEILQKVPEEYSYFQLDPFHNGDVGPFLAAITTVALLCVLLVSLYGKPTKRRHVIMVVLSAVALAFSLLPLVFYGFDSFTMVGLTISYLLLCSLVMSIQRLTGRPFYIENDEDE